MGLSDASWFAATVAILLGIYIGERILDIDFSVFLAKNRKKGKIKRMMEQRGDTTLQKSGIRRDIRKAFERILIPLEKADKNRLPSRMDMTFRKNIVRQIDRLNQQKLCREILMTDVETQPDNDFERWNNDGREWRESINGALSEKLGADWQAKLIPWSSRPALSGLELGSYNTAADGSQTVDIQSRFAGYSVAVFDASDALWQALNS